VLDGAVAEKEAKYVKWKEKSQKRNGENPWMNQWHRRIAGRRSARIKNLIEDEGPCRDMNEI
jgi:hypothetical protein